MISSSIAKHSKPRVTIGLCARNSEACIALAVESIIKQNFPHELIEIVFVDDGSEDNTLGIMLDYVSKIDIPTKVFSSEWRGLGKARNTVLDIAEGDYIVWLDSDEVMEKDFIRRQIAVMDENPEIGILVGHLRILPKENLVLSLDLIPSMFAYATTDWSNSSKLPGTGGTTYRTVAARQAGGFDVDIKGTGEDIDIALRIRQKGWLITGGKGVFYETHGQLATWRDLWRRYSNYGAHSNFLHRKSGELFSLYRMNPLASLITALLSTVDSYRFSKRKIAFLLPFHFTFKRIAWFYGFSKSNLKM